LAIKGEVGKAIFFFLTSARVNEAKIIAVSQAWHIGVLWETILCFKLPVACFATASAIQAIVPSDALVGAFRAVKDIRHPGVELFAVIGVVGAFIRPLDVADESGEVTATASLCVADIEAVDTARSLVVPINAVVIQFFRELSF